MTRYISERQTIFKLKNYFKLSFMYVTFCIGWKVHDSLMVSLVPGRYYRNQRSMKFLLFQQTNDTVVYITYIRTSTNDHELLSATSTSHAAMVVSDSYPSY
jgi:hypothetical protein